MKVLSIKQPWAWLIAAGHKDIENRTWKTRYRGPFLIHASKEIDRHVMHNWDYELPPIMKGKMPVSFHCGVIIGQCEIVDCVDKSDSIWFTGPVGFVIKNAELFPETKHLPVKGRLGFFEI